MITTDWQEVRLRYVVELNPTIPPEIRRSSETQVSFLPMEALGENGSFDATATRRVGDVLTGYSFFENDDIVYAKVTPCFENGKAAVLDGLVEKVGFGTTEVTVVRAKDSVDTKFLFYVLIEDRFKQFGKAEMTGAGGLKRVPESFTKNFKVLLPPLSDQRAIASFLDHETAEIDAFIEDQKELITLLNERRAATITRAVTKGLDPSVQLKDSGFDWLGKVPEHWQVSPLKRLGTIRYGIGEPPGYVSEGVPLIRATNVSEGRITPEKMVLVNPADIPAARILWLRKGDIIVVRSGALTGDSAIVRDEYAGAIAGFDMVFRSSASTNADFIQYGLLSSYVKSAQLDIARMRAAQPHLNAEELGNSYFAHPTSRSEYEQIVKYLDFETAEIDAAIADAKEAIELSKERRAALISAAVTGKIDVRDHIPAELGAA
ncbi:restriction endonuclease subunit S [Arthrobacter crystallopoietes]|uniref:restriction endonuclease subunit S n=1 Tax=Crystallibacter crystallopoietes TaxID=37928 RepID=UPI003D22C3A3